VPYHLSKDKLSVLDDTGKVVKKHSTKAKAKAHLIALNINVSKPELKKTIPKKKAESILRYLEAVSYDALRDKIRQELIKLIPDSRYGGPWIAEHFDEYVIVELDTLEGYDYWQIPYTLSGEEVTLSDRIDWIQVERKQTWVEASEARRIEYVQ